MPLSLASTDPLFALDFSQDLDPIHHFTTADPLMQLSPGPSGDPLCCLTEMEPLPPRIPLCPLNGVDRLCTGVVPQAAPKTPPSPVMLYGNERKTLQEMSPLLSAGHDLRQNLFEAQSFDGAADLDCEQSPVGPMIRICRSCRVLGSRVHSQGPEDSCIHSMKLEDP